MIFFPAIDLKGGHCVRLVRGDMARATVFSEDPACQARSFEEAGCEWIHVVDLDGAVSGRSVNGDAVRAVVASVTVPVQLGGGLRTLESIERWLDTGVERVVLGTAAVEDPGLVRTACRVFPGRVVVSIDARDGRVAVDGWVHTRERSAGELARAYEDSGVAALVHTDIGRDGTMTGPNLGATVALASSVSTPVILSGGVAAMADLEAVRDDAPILHGVIVGRAVYEGRIDPGAAVALLRGGQG